jgi:hypothetical protein
MAKPKVPQMPAEVPQFVIDKADALIKAVRPLGHPRAARQDRVGALVDAATAETASAALDAYNPKLGRALEELDTATELPASDDAEEAP